MATERVRLIDPLAELADAQKLARRYHCEFVDLKEGKLDHELLRLVPVDMMFRYNFVPVGEVDGVHQDKSSSPRPRSGTPIAQDRISILQSKYHWADAPGYRPTPLVCP